MRRHSLIGFLFVFAFLCGRVWAQPAPIIEWQKCLGGSTDDEAQSIVHTSDGGFAIAGYTTSPNDGNVSGNHGGEDGWVVKIDSNGAIQWQKCLGGAETDFLNAIIQTSDGGYAVAGKTFSNDGDASGNHGGGDAWVVRLNDTGGIQWQKCLGGTLEDVANSIVQTSDGGFIMAGYTESSDGEVVGYHGDGDCWVVKLNDTGGIQWQHSLGGTGYDNGASIIQSSDGGYVATGSTNSNDSDVHGNHGSEDVWVVKLYSTGGIEWQACLGGTADDWGNSIVQTTDGGFAVASYTASNDDEVSGNHGTYDFWVAKLDVGGNLQWQKCLGGVDGDIANSIIQTSDGGFAVAGLTYSKTYEVTGDHGGGDEWVVKLNDTGAIQWQKCLGGTSYEQANSIIQIPGGEYAVAGYTGSNDSDVSGNHGGEDMWVLKLGNAIPPVISYITPDAGAPGMCVAVEIIGPAGEQNNFGHDTIYSTNGLVSLVRASDTSLVQLGPSIVSWNGRQIQQMFMLKPYAGPIDTEIYFVVTVNGVTSAPNSFHIVTPAPAIIQNGGGTLLTNGRTARNTLVIDSLILSNGTFTCPLTDPDPNTPGNQGYLPLRILSKGHIQLSNATLSADGSSGTTGTSGGSGGPGGGGGGSGYPGAGGAGFTGGGGDNDNANGPGGAGTGSTNGSSAWFGGMSLDSATGGLGEQHTSGGGDDGGGGGTGHPFGTSGQNGGNSSSPSAGFGGASAGGSTSSYLTNYGGGGGGNESAGANGQGTGNNGGLAVGNLMLIPLFGGSGGGAGNQTYISFLGNSKGGCGGGGGGAIELTSFAKLEVLNSTISAQGGNGSNAVPLESAAGGGGGSGGAIALDARDSLTIDRTSVFKVSGGQGGTSSDANSNGGNGGIGRIRIDGFASKYASDSSNKYFLPQNGFAGPSIERISFTADSFYVHAHAEYWDTMPKIPLQILIYWRWPSTGIWQSGSATFIPDNGSHSAGWIYGNVVPPNPADSEIYAVAVQLAQPLSDPHVDVPGYVMSHTSGIIAKVTGPPQDSVSPTTIEFGNVLVGRCSDDTTIEIYSTGKSALSVDSATLVGNDPSQFKIVSITPQLVPPGDSIAITLKFCPDSLICPMNARLRVFTSAGPVIDTLLGCGVQPQMIIRPMVLDFGRIHIDNCKDSFVVVSNPGKDPLTISAEDVGGPQFKVLDTLPLIVSAGDSARLHLRFCPSDTILTIGYDSVQGDAPQSPITVILMGEGKIGILSAPRVIDFGDVREGNCKDSIFFVGNTGNDSLILEGDPISASGFTSISPSFPDTLKPNDSLPIDIRFCSTDTGSFQATLLAGTDVPSTDSITLLAHTGLGILQILNVIDFGSVAIGGCSDTTVQIKNVGTDTLVLAAGSNFQPPFSYPGPSPFVLAPGEISTITLRFCPQDTNEATETTEFDTIGAGTNQIFTLRGKGVEGALSTSGPIDLGCITLGSSDTGTIKIGNTGKVTLQNITDTLTPAGSATIVHSPPATLAPGAQDSVVLIIPAQTLGAFSATLTITSSSGTPVTIPITGEVSAPPAIVSLDTILEFDTVNIGDSLELCMRITNYSCAPEDSIYIDVDGLGRTDSAFYPSFSSVSKDEFSSLVNGAVDTFCVWFRPRTAGPDTAEVQIGSSTDHWQYRFVTALHGYGRGTSVAVELAIDTVAGRPGDIVNVPVRTLNDVTTASIDSVTFRVSFNPMQLDLKAPVAPITSGIETNATPAYSVTSHSIGDKTITATFPTPLSGTPIIAELPFEILQPTANTAAIHLVSASFGFADATLATTSDGLIQIEQCDTNDRVAIAITPIDVAQNNPNPFSARSSMNVNVHTAGHLTLDVYNALGVKVLTPFDGDVGVGTQTIELNANALASGAYRCITTWTWTGSNPPAYQPTLMRDEKTLILLGD